MENYSELDAKRDGLYARLAAGSPACGQILDAYAKITGNRHIFANAPDNLPPLMVEKAAALCERCYGMVKDSPEYLELALVEKRLAQLSRGARRPVIRQQGVASSPPPEPSAPLGQTFGESISAFDNPKRIQGMLIEEDDPFAEDEDNAPAAPTMSMIAEDDDDSLLFGASPESKASANAEAERMPTPKPHAARHVEEINNAPFNPLMEDGVGKGEDDAGRESGWQNLNNMSGPEGDFNPEDELDDFDISKPVGVIRQEGDDAEPKRQPGAFAFREDEEEADISPAPPVPGTAREIPEERIVRASKHINDVYYDEPAEESVPESREEAESIRPAVFEASDAEDGEADENPFTVRGNGPAQPAAAPRGMEEEEADDDPFRAAAPSRPAPPREEPAPPVEEPEEGTDFMVNDAGMDQYRQHMENRSAEERKLREQSEQSYVDGKLQREASYAEYQSGESAPKMVSYRGKMVSQAEYDRLIQEEINGYSDDAASEAQNAAVSEEPAAPEEKFAPEEPPIEEPDESGLDLNEPDFEKASGESPSFDANDPAAPVQEPDFEKGSGDGQPAFEDFDRDETHSVQASGKPVSENQARAEELGRQIHNEDDPFRNDKLSSDVEDAIESGSCLDDINNFASIFHDGASEEKKKSEKGESKGGGSGGFSFENLFAKITGGFGK